VVVFEAAQSSCWMDWPVIFVKKREGSNLFIVNLHAK
jgi:hypothetical protein